MNLLKIHCLSNEPLRCRWVSNWGNASFATGEGALDSGLLTGLPQSADRVQLILSAAQVLLARVRLPGGSRARRDSSILAFAVEEETLSEPAANQVTWIGRSGDEDVVAVADRAMLQRWLDALAAAAIHVDEVYCETLLLPWKANEWSFAWNGQEGFVRTGEFEGAATDRGSSILPPLSLHLLLEEAERRGARPAALSLYTMPMNDPAGELTAEPMPDVEAWQRELGIPVRLGGTWNYAASPPVSSGSSIGFPWGHKARQDFSKLWARLRPAAWLVSAALGIHVMALTVDWALLASEQKTLRRQMESQFRAVFPAAVAVVDPALQMRRKLIEARREVGLPDNGDFLPMMENMAAELRELAPGSLRAITYDGGRLALELTVNDAAAQRIATDLRKHGLSIETSQAPAGMESGIIVIQARVL